MKIRIPKNGEIVRRFAWWWTKVWLYKPTGGDLCSAKSDNEAYKIWLRFYFVEVRYDLLKNPGFLKKKK